MASHGIPRSQTREQRTAEVRQKELREIEQYQSLNTEIQHGVEVDDLSPELLEKTSALLRKNPEHYTIWNVRRRIFAREFENLINKIQKQEIAEDRRQSEVLDIINLDLNFLFPLLLQYPKCYWIWNHRLWLLKQASLYLPVERARGLWKDELNLVSKMLTRDSRNFHGWGYRATVVDKLESSELQGSSLSRTEYDYTTKMIGQNLSNFSAWHARSRLILKMLDEENASAIQRKQMLDDELQLIHKTLFDPYDQSLWFYHQNLMSNFDPNTSERAIAPDLSKEEKVAYVKDEIEFIEDLVEDAADSKWVYQALMSCALIEGRLTGALADTTKQNVQVWLEKLKKLDPLRSGRWQDLQHELLDDSRRSRRDMLLAVQQADRCFGVQDTSAWICDYKMWLKAKQNNLSLLELLVADPSYLVLSTSLALVKDFVPVVETVASVKSISKTLYLQHGELQDILAHHQRLHNSKREIY